MRGLEQFFELPTKRGILRGMLHLPNHMDADKIVIFVHGFTGNRMDHHFMFVKTARELSHRGIAVLRFDFLGSGESDGDFAEMTYRRELEQAELVLEEVSTWEWVSEISLLGFSMGGAIAAQLAGMHPTKIHKLLLWAPAGEMPLYVKQRFNDPKIVRLENGNVDLGGFELGRGFIDEMMTLDLFEGIKRYTGLVKIIHGTKDEAVSLLTSVRYVDTYDQGVEFIEIKGADHCFTSVHFTKELISETVVYLTK
ncbi:MAG TPA: alpha/beta hydrolase [Firmicutes bacterium]|nr:alpha/beta hydrolase [Bacillota bacterium]